MEDLEKKYFDLFMYLLELYPNKVKLNDDKVKLNDDNEIEVEETDELFNYDSTEFFNVDIDSFKLSKIVKSYSDFFYCQWKDCFTQKISIFN
jgi:hypothetical protein